MNRGVRVASIARISGEVMALNEPAMNASDPVVAGMPYIAIGVGILANLVAPVYVRSDGGVPIVSSITGLVSDLKTLLGATGIARCDVAGRRGTFASTGLQFPDG